MFFSRILWILAVIAFATSEVLLLAGLIPAARSETFIGKAVGLCRHARKGALVGLLVSLGIIMLRRSVFCHETSKKVL